MILPDWQCHCDSSSWRAAWNKKWHLWVFLCDCMQVREHCYISRRKSISECLCLALFNTNWQTIHAQGKSICPKGFSYKEVLSHFCCQSSKGPRYGATEGKVHAMWLRIFLHWDPCKWHYVLLFIFKEKKPDTLNLSFEVWVLVENFNLFLPVELVFPVGDNLPEICWVNSIMEATVLQGLSESSLVKPSK